MSVCEVVEMRNSADEIGYSCSRTANAECSDCGSELCESHTETCGICNGVFCPSCLTFHSVQHSKPAVADHGKGREPVANVQYRCNETEGLNEHTNKETFTPQNCRCESFYSHG